MSSSDREKIEILLSKMEPSRRKFLKRILLGGGAAAMISLPTSTLLVPEAEAQRGPRGGGGRGGGRGRSGGRGRPEANVMR